MFAAVALVAAILVWRLARPGEQASAPRDVVPLTSSTGSEEEPSFSPDGKQVAFSWDGENQDNFDIYVKLIGAPKPLRLTTDSAEDRGPAFSPDGQSIGFTRVANGRLSYVVTPAIGGGERVVADLGPDVRDPTVPYGWSCSSAWLRDGKSVIVDGLKRVSLETGEVRTLSSRSSARVTGWYPAIAADGRTLAFARQSSRGATGIYLLHLSDRGEPTGEPRIVTMFDGDVSGIAWTGDNLHLVFSGGRLSGSSGTSKVLWRVAATEGAQPERLPFGDDATSPAISPASGRIAFVRTTFDVNIWRARLGDGSTPSTAARFVSSTLPEWNPQYSPDGRRLAFESKRTGESAIWVGDADGSNLVEVFSRAGKHSGTPRWAPDNERLAFDSTAEGSFDIYVIRAGSAQPARLTADPADDAMPSWSPDGRWIYFGSMRTGRWEVWKVPAAGGQATQVTRNGGSCAFPSADGTRIYYTKHDGDAALWSMHVTSGAETQVLPSVVGRAFVVFADGIYFAPRADPTGRYAIHFLPFASGVASPVVAIASSPGLGLAVSLDRREILYPLGDATGSDLMLVEGFQ